MAKFQFIDLDELDENNQPIPQDDDDAAWNRLLLPKQSFSTIKDYSSNSLKYGFPVHPGEDPYEIAAQNQSTTSKWVNGLTKASVTALGSATENLGLVFAAPSQMIYNSIDGEKSVASGLYDNWLGQFVDNINKSLQEKLPNYYTRAEREKSFAEELGTANFWADKFANGAGYWLGAMITPWGLEQGLTKTGIKGLVKNSIREAGEGQAGKALQSIAGSTNTAEFSNLLKVAGTGTLMSVGESNVEARQTKQETLDKLVSLRESGDEKFKNKTDKELEDIAAAAGNSAYLGNLMVTMPTNVLQFGKLIPGFKSLTSSAPNLIREGVGKYTAKEANKALSRTLSFGSGFLEEGGQELAQLGIQKGTQDYYTRQLDPETRGNFVDAMQASLKAAYDNLGTKEGLESIFLGGILGGPGQLVQNWNKSSKEYTQAQQLSKILSPEYYKDLASLADDIIVAKKSGKLAEEALQQGNKEEFFTERFNVLKSYAKAVSNNGGTEFLINDLEQLKESSAEEIKKVLQIPTGEEWNESTKNEKIDLLINQVKSVDILNTQLKAKFPEYAESKDPAKRAVFNAIFDGVTGLKDINERETQLAKEADDLLIQASVDRTNIYDLLGKAQEMTTLSESKDKVKELSNKIKAVEKNNPDIAEQLKEKQKAFEYLNKERERLVKQFEEAVKTPEKIEKKVNDLTPKDTVSPNKPTVNAEEYSTEEVKDFIKKAEVDTKINPEEATTKEDIQSTYENAIKHYSNKLRELEAKVKEFAPEGLETQQGIEFKKLRDSGIYQAKLAEAQKNLNDLKTASKEETKISSVILFNHIRLNQMVQLYEAKDNIDLFNKISFKELVDNLELKFIDYPEEGEEVFAFDHFDKTQSKNVKVVKGLIGTKKGVQIVFKGEIIGQLNDPGRFRFKTSKGTFIPFNKSVEHLEMLNPNFVIIDNKGNKVASEQGLEYNNTYDASVKAFEDLKKRSENTNLLRNDEVKSIFFVASSVSVDQPKEIVRTIDYFKKNSWMTSQSHLGHEQGALVYDRAASKFFVFNGENFDEIPTQYNEFYYNKYIKGNEDIEKLKTNFVGVISEYKDYKNNTRISVSAINYGKSQNTEPVADSIVKEFTKISDKFKELTEEGTLKANKIVGIDTQDMGIFISSDSKVTINLKISGKKEGSEVKYPGLSLKIEENRQSRFVSLSDKKSNSSIYISTDKEGVKTLVFREGNNTKTISTNEQLKEALNTVLKDNKETVQILNFLKRDRITSKTLEDSVIAREAKRTLYFVPQKEKYFGKAEVSKEEGFTQPTSGVFSMLKDAQPPADGDGFTKQEGKPGVFSLISTANPVVITTPITSDIEDKKADIERRRQEELNQQTDAGYSTIALDYLFTGGRDVILSTDYLLQALVGGFTHSAKEINDIRNKYANKLGNIRDDINSDVYNQMMGEIRNVISKTYNDSKANEIFDKILKNATGFTSREGNQVSIELDKLNEQNESKINAKYDAELAALEQIKTKKDESKNNETKTEEAKKEGLLREVNPLEEEYNKLTAERSALRAKVDKLSEEEIKRFFQLGSEISALEVALMSSNKTKDAFKISNRAASEQIVINDAIENLKRILPKDFISDKTLEEINLNLYNNGITWGGFINSMIYLSKYAEKGTEYHEAFHAVFRSFLSDTEQLIVYKEAKSKYGKPTASQLIELQKTSVDYSQLTNKQLEMLWLEEKLADDFQNYSKKGFKGFLLRLFNRIKLFLNAIRGKESSIESLFDNIYSGKYKSAELVNSNFAAGKSAYKVLEKAAYKTPSGEFTSGYLSPLQNAQVISRISYKAIKHLKENGTLNDEDIINISNNLALRYYNPILFKDILLPMVVDNPNKFSTIENSINDISGALTNDRNRKLIIDTVREKISHYIEIKDFEEEESVVEDNLPTEFGIKDNFLIGGFASASKKMREYLSFIETGVDEFNFGLTEEQLLEDRFQGFLNPHEVYNNIESTLVNTQRDRMLKKLFHLSQYNKNINSFLRYMAKDIFKELGLDKNLPKEELLTIDFKTLAKSSIFNSFISNFQKIRQTSVDVIPNIEAGTVKVIRTNLQDVQDSQVAQWYRNWIFKEPNLKTAEQLTESIKNKIIAYDSIYVNNINNAVNFIKNGLSDLGIEVSPLFIKYSIVANAIKSGEFKKYKDSISDESTLKEIENLEELYSLFSGINILDEEFFKGLSYGIKSGNPYKEDENNEGSIGRLKTIALSNSFFDENVGNSTYQNIEGKTIYVNLFPNYFSYEAMLWQEEGRRAWIFEEEDKAKKALKEILEAQGKSIDKYQFNKYYQAVKYNPLIKGLMGVKDSEGDFTDEVTYSKEFSDLIFNNFKAFINGGLKEEAESVGTAHASLTKRGKYLTLLSYFSKSSNNSYYEKRALPKGLIEKGGKLEKNPKFTYEFALFKPIQNEGKNTQYIYSMPIQKYFSKDKLTKLGEEAFKSFFIQEYERIGEVQKEINFNSSIKVDDYNIGKLRGLDFWTFKSIKDINPELYSSLINDAKNNTPLTDVKLVEVMLAINDMLNEEYKLFYNDLITEKIIDSNEDGILLPSFYIKDTKVDQNKLKDFFFNDYINTLSFNNLMFGDIAMNFKHPIDFVKRMPGANAAGPSIGVDESRVAVISDDILADGTNSSDAQAYSNSFYLIRKYLQGLGKKSPLVENILKKITRGENLSEGEVRILTNETALANPKKLSLFDLFFYGKTSVKFLLRSQVSYRDKKDKQKINDLYTELESFEIGSKEYNYILNKIHQLWKPMPGQEKLHDLLNKMEKQNVDIVLRESAVKTQIVNKTEIEEALRPIVISDNYIREQVITDGIKNKIIHGTQLIQLITSEQDVKTIVEFLGNDTTLGKSVEAYRKLLADRISMTYKEVREVLFKDGVKSYEQILEIMSKSLSESNADSSTIELFAKGVADEPEYSLNNPRIEQKFENMYLAFVKNIFSHKVPGLKLSLSSDSGNEVFVQDLGEGKDRVITRKEFLKNPEKFVNKDGSYKDGFSTRRLTEKQEGNIYYGECKVSASIASHFKIKEGDVVNADLFNLVATRIPTQDKHSMAYLKIVEILPGETGNELVVPAKFVKLAGFDFDIDAEYTRFKSFIKDKLTGKFHIFGDYLKAKDNEEASILAFKEFVEDSLLHNHKLAKDLKELKKTDVEYNNTLNAVQEIREELKGISSDYDAYINEAINSIMDSELGIEESKNVIKEFFPEEYKLLESRKLILSKTDETVKELVNDIVAGSYVVKRKNKRLKELVLEKKNVKIELFYELMVAKEQLLLEEKQLLNKALEINKLPKSIKEFSDKYSKQIENNIKHLDNGDIDKINPITVSEINNLLFDIEKNLIRNIGNKEIADTPASRDLAENFIKEYYKKLGFNDPTKVSSVASVFSKVTLDDANSVGKANIGIAALNNTSFQYLADAGIKSRIDGDNFPKNKVLNNERINDIISTNVTMATDNAKHQDAAFMNLTTETLGASMYALNTKRDFDFVMLVNIQEDVKKLSKSLLNISGDIKTEDEMFIKKRDFIENSLSLSIKNYGVAVKLANSESKIEELTHGNLIKAILFKQGSEVENFTELDYLKIQELAMREFADNKMKSEFLRNFTVLTSLIKGPASEWSKVNNVHTAIKKLGLVLVEKANTGSIEDFELMHSDEFNNPKLIKDYPFDVLPAIINNKFLYAEIKAFGAMIRDSKEFFIIQTEVAKEIQENLEKDFKPEHFDFPDNFKKFKNDLLSYLMIKSFKHQTGVTTSFFNVLSEKEVPTKLIQLYNRLLGVDYWRSNLFIKSVQPSVSDKAIFGDFYIHSLNTNTRIELNPEYKRMVSEAFTELFNGTSYKNVTQEENELAREFAVEAIKYLISKDAAGFKNASFIQFIEPNLFKRMNQSMKQVEQTLSKDVGYQDIFGLSKNELIDEFSELFRRNVTNFYNLRKEARINNPSIGDRNMSPYAFTVEEWNNLLGMETKVKEEPKEFTEEIVKSKTPEYDKLPFKSSTPTMIYAGVGSRETPTDVQTKMTELAKELEAKGYTLRSGGAIGADTAFAKGANKKEIFYAKDTNDTVRAIAKEIHPNPYAISKNQFVLDLQARNTFQVFGKNLDIPVDFVIAWTKDGKATGGTGQAIRLATGKNIPVINLFNPNWRKDLDNVLEGKEIETKPKSTQLDLFTEEEVKGCDSPI